MSSAVLATRISSPGVRKASMPGHASVMMQLPQPAASNTRVGGL